MSASSGRRQGSTDDPRAAPPGPRRGLPWFDLLGGLAVAAFATLLLLDLGALARPREEISLRVDPRALAEGFREGVQWYGLYRGEQKVGFSRTERRRSGDGYRLVNRIQLRPGTGGGPTLLQVDTELDRAFALRRFTVLAEGGPVPLRAAGEVRGSLLHVEAEGLPGLPELDLPLREPPVFDFDLGPLVMRADLAPGDRFAFTHVDPLGLTPREGTLEVLGRESLDVLGEEVSAVLLRQQIAGLPPLRLWVNELGEVLQQELPLQLLAVREAEAEATWGMTSPAAAQESP
ncbi:MAG: hypothetical protein H6712_24530 [Myxococcales bacterium]|nr:hypothetical protein [Myxococcales bacterium]MCB9717046.1 hypothetical protein [Myxococcales bacterium]